MNETERDAPRSNWLSWVFCLLLFYVLSVGPVFGLFRRGIIPLDVWMRLEVTVYDPIYLLRTYSEEARAAYKWYIGLFWQ